MAKNANLNRAAQVKQDEFYTQIADIEREMRHYIEHFKDKIVFCNCDDPETSNFWMFFENSFKQLTAFPPDSGITVFVIVLFWHGILIHPIELVIRLAYVVNQVIVSVKHGHHFQDSVNTI